MFESLPNFFYNGLKKKQIAAQVNANSSTQWLTPSPTPVSVTVTEVTVFDFIFYKKKLAYCTSMEKGHRHIDEIE